MDPRISNENIQYFYEKIGNPDFYNYQLCVTGPIGAGKTTLIEALKCLFKSLVENSVNKEQYSESVQELPEYLGIDPEFGQRMLERKINKEISNTTFQNYIVDMYSLRLRQLNDKFMIRFIERLPEDSVLCFSNISNFHDRDNKDKFEKYLELSDFDLYTIKQRFDNLKDLYELPSYADKQTEFINISSCDFNDLIMSVVDIIADDLQSGVTKRIIGLDLSFEITLRRIMKRNRNGESNYSKDWLKMICNFYSKLYQQINQDKNKLNHFTYIASLL